MRILVTGAGGFVGTHVVTSLGCICGDTAEILLTGKNGSGKLEPLDVTDRDAVVTAMAELRPSHVIHLAGIAAPAKAAHAPEAAWRVHVDGTLNWARAILDRSPNTWLIYAGSGLVYGESARSGEPLDEDTLLAPMDDYAVTKAAADLALGAMAHKGLRCIRMRPFNHIGPGQTDSFVASAFAMQIARIETGLDEPILRVGNLQAERDFLDVRDVADAYALTIIRSNTIAPGTIMNLASGTPRCIADLLNALLSMSRAEIKIEQDPARMRPVDLPRIVGNADRARRKLNWSPRRPFDETLADILADCRQRVADQ
jgi:GDP-4-dehydro-6-deoxy-D-mannose reductase